MKTMKKSPEQSGDFFCFCDTNGRAAVFPKVDSPLRARGLMAPPGLSALGAKGSVRDRLTPPGPVEGLPAQGSYIASLRWRGGRLPAPFYMPLRGGDCCADTYIRRQADYILAPKGAHRNPLNPLNPLHLLNPFLCPLSEANTTFLHNLRRQPRPPSSFGNTVQRHP